MLTVISSGALKTFKAPTLERPCPFSIFDNPAINTKIPETRSSTLCLLMDFQKTYKDRTTCSTRFNKCLNHKLLSSMHYRKQSLHRELEASARAKSAALGEAPLRRERKVWLSAKDWPTVISTFAESFLSSALGEGLG
jgi:hypothetical protein